MLQKVNVEEYLKYCDKYDIKIEYTSKFEITNDCLSGGTDMLYDHEAFYALLPNGMFDSYFDKFTEDGHHFWLSKWMAQDFLERGCIIPLNVGALRYGISKIIRYRIHPGGGKLNVLNFLEMKLVPAFVTSFERDNIDYGGKRIRSLDDFLLIWNELDKIYESFIDFDPAINELFGDDTKMKKLDIVTRGNYKEEGWMYDPPSSYSKIARNSIPLKVYIEGENFEQCRDRILVCKDRDNCEFKEYREPGFSSSMNHNSSAMKLKIPYEIECIKLKDDKFCIPELNRFSGFSIYIDSEIKFKRDMFELLFFGHSEKAMCLYSKKLILFNCQHPSWKYTDKPLKEHTGLLPKHYYES